MWLSFLTHSVVKLYSCQIAGLRVTRITVEVGLELRLKFRIRVKAGARIRVRVGVVKVLVGVGTTQQEAADCRRSFVNSACCSAQIGTVVSSADDYRMSVLKRTRCQLHTAGYPVIPSFFYTVYSIELAN